MAEMLMPRLSESMADGVIVRWLREPGARVEQGDELVEIETDKATVTCESESSGVLEILAAEGETRAIGEPIARIGAPPGGDQRFKASPLARRLAAERGIDLADVQGSGPGGRIVRADLDAHGQHTDAGGGHGDTGGGHGELRGPVTVVEPTHSQRLVAERMSESRRTIPDFTVTTEIDVSRCAELRDRLGAATGTAPTYNDMVVKAAALALREHPHVNASYADGRFHLHGRINVGIAVDTGDDLLVPTVFDADRLPLPELARTTRSLAGRARDGRLTPGEQDGGTFTVSNLGAYGVTEFTAIINPPQVAILAAGAVSEDGLLRATLTCDHRVLYGAGAARFLARIRELLTEPILLLVDEGRAP